MSAIRNGAASGWVRCSVLALALCACAPRGEGGPPTPTVRGGEKVYAPTGPGRHLEPVVDPEFHIANARRDFEAGLHGSAAREIEKLEAFLAYEEARASGDHRRAIEDAREELDELAERVAHREVKDVSELDRAFSHARAALVR
jgi:hypothetical protein